MFPCQCTKINYHEEAVEACSESLYFEINAAQDGEYILSLSFLGTSVEIKRLFEAGEQLVFPLKGLNEDFEYLAAIVAPDKSMVVKTIEGETYNCFHFKTGFKKSL